MKQIFWGIDLGGTKIEAVVLEMGTEPKVEVLSRLRVPTEAKQGYAHVLGQIQKVIQLTIKETGLTPKKVGIGTPGTLDPQTQTLKNSNTLCLNGQAVQKDLEDLLKIPVQIANDANCFALAEARLGAVPQALPTAQVVFGVIMGTGVGGGLVVDGKVIQG